MDFAENDLTGSLHKVFECHIGRNALFPYQHTLIERLYYSILQV